MRPYKKILDNRIQIPKVIIILGPPGSGKGTQAKLLMRKFDLEYFGSGAALRERQEISDFTGKKIREFVERGEWVPEFVISKLWMDKLEEFKRKKKFNGFVSDGSPRRIIEAQLFDQALEWYRWDRSVKVLLINISREESFNRLTKRRQCKKCGRLIPWAGKFKKLKRCDKCGGELIVREDDKPRAIKKRLKEFKEKTIPVVNYYKKRDKLIKINGGQSIEEVFKDILKTIK